MSKETVYTAEVIERMNEEYSSAQSDEERATVVKDFAEELKVSQASVRAKLVNMGIYKAKVRVAKNGEKVESKADIVRDIAKLMNVNEEVAESLEKATKPILKMVRKALTVE